jgi:hypothetical protein
MTKETTKEFRKEQVKKAQRDVFRGLTENTKIYGMSNNASKFITDRDEKLKNDKNTTWGKIFSK